MKGRIIFVKVKSGASAKLIDDVLYAGQTVSMSPRILFRGNQVTPLAGKGIFLAGVNHGNNDFVTATG